MENFVLKKCKKCGENKSINDFFAQKDTKDGKRSQCKNCVKKSINIWQKENSAKKKEYDRKWNINNRERKRELNRKWVSKNPDKAKLSAQNWNKNNPDKIREIQKKHDKLKLSTPQGRINNRIRSAMHKSLKGTKANRAWELLVGYTAEKLKEHIEKQFVDGMTWERFMKGEIHIDHKIPISAFNFEKPEDEDFKRCWSLKNLQPLWAKDNREKWDRLDRHFQPKLIFKILSI